MFTMSPMQANVGQSSVNLTITGASLNSVTDLILASDILADSDYGIVISGFAINPAGTQITATLNITGSAQIGHHEVFLNTTSGLVTPKIDFHISSAAGLTFFDFSPEEVNASTNGVSFTFNGSNLSGITGLKFVRPDGTVDNGVTTTGSLSVTPNSVTGSINVGNVILGPRQAVFTTGGSDIVTTRGVVVESQALGILPSVLFPNRASPGQQQDIIIGDMLTGVTGMKFKLGGVDDSAIQVTNFVNGPNGVSAHISVAGGTPLGVRQVVFLVGATEVPTTLIFKVNN